MILSAQPVWGQKVIIEGNEAKDIARRNGLLIRKESPSGVIELMAIADGLPWYNTTFNAAAADSISTDECFSGGSGGLSLGGSGVTLGVWDAAGVRLTHQEFGGRASQADGQTITHWHSTHVAGTMIAAGIDALARGMSPAASLDCYDWSNDIAEMSAAAAAGLRVSNHSYGFVQGWVYDSVNDVYYWYGDRNVSNAEDYRFGLYGGFSYFLDVAAADYPYYLICRSAGNDRADAGPTGPEPTHLHLKTPYNVEWEDGIDAHDPDGDYDSITTRNTAKNILTVGAVDDVTLGYSGPSSVVMSTFSGWGPCDDGRIKPDIVGNGINLYSTMDANDADYGILSGTSMAAPNVAGSLGLLIEHWRATHPSENDMRSATLKGLVLHTADEAGAADGPDYQFGWGLMNTLSAATVISADAGEPLTISEWNLNDGDWVELLVTTDGTSALRATICWTDPPGPWQSGVVDPPTKILVNDLDLRIVRSSTGTTYLPWVLDSANPPAAAARADNDTDNVEQVVVDIPGADSFVLRVTHKGVLSGGAQAFSLVLSGAAQIQVPRAQISGSVASSAATPLAGVQVIGTNSGESYVTDATGSYELFLPIGQSETITLCKQGWTFAPSGQSYSPVTGDLSGQDFTAALVYDLDPPGVGDEFVSVGDLSYFAASWQQSVPPADPRHDFDCDGVVGVGDFSFFVTAWLKNVFDPNIAFPACGLCGGGGPGQEGEVQPQLRLVAVAAPSPQETARRLPRAVRRVWVGQTYFVEMWVRNRSGTGPGITSSYADVMLPSTRSAVRAIWTSQGFGTFADGVINGSAVRDLGGSALTAGAGPGGSWARVATVEVDAIAPGRARYGLRASPLGLAAYGRGIIPWPDIVRSGVAVRHIGLRAATDYGGG